MIKKIYEIHCDYCGFNETDKLAQFNGQAINKFRSRGWAINTTIYKAKCPECRKEKRHTVKHDEKRVA